MNISSIETMSFHDGPGLRIVYFLQGCPLRCSFCHNPETWEIEDKKIMTTDEIVDFTLKYKNYIEEGGVTFSGGEPLLQAEVLKEVCKELKKNNIDIALDTSGIGSTDYEILDYVDIVLFDIKALNKKDYSDITTGNLETSLKFLEEANKRNKKVIIRQVIIPNINDNEEYIKDLKKLLTNYKYDKVELLSYHRMGIKKYEDLNIPYKLSETPNMDQNKVKKLQESFDNLV